MKNLSLFFSLFLALLIGMSMVTQTGINNQLRETIHSALQAAFISFLIGTVLLGLIVIAGPSPLPKLQTLLTMPVYLWVGGVLGIICVTGSIFIASRLGALSSTVAIVAGQIIFSVIFDHFGLLGYPKYNVNYERILGVFLVLGGVLLVIKKN